MALPGNPLFAPQIKIARAEKESLGTVGFCGCAVWMAVWPILGKGVSREEHPGGDSWRIGHPWHLGPFHSGPRSHLWDCVFNSASQGETRLPVATGLGVTPVVVGDGMACGGRGGQGLLCTASGKETFDEQKVVCGDTSGLG